MLIGCLLFNCLLEVLLCLQHKLREFEVGRCGSDHLFTLENCDAIADEKWTDDCFDRGVRLALENAFEEVEERIVEEQLEKLLDFNQ